MYNLLLIIGLGAGIFAGAVGFQRGRRMLIGIGAVVIVLTFAFFWLLGFWGEMLWFEALGQSTRFWKEVFTRFGLAFAAAAVAWVLTYVLLLWTSRKKMLPRIGAQVLAALFGFGWGAANWETFLRYMQGVKTNVQDPILGYDTGFYLFSLPWYDAVFALLLVTGVIALVASAIASFVRFPEGGMEFDVFQEHSSERPAGFTSMYASAALLALVFALGAYLGRLHVMYSTTGVVTGPGWTDAHIRLPAYTIAGVVAVALAVALIGLAVWSKRGKYPGPFRGVPRQYEAPVFIATAAVALAVVWFIGLAAIPGLFQWLRVEPNEISFEKPYIAHNIEFTRRAFGLYDVTQREFPVTGDFTRQTVAENRHLFKNIRLWDYRALDAVYKQFQEIRLYFEFVDVDIDRYTIGDEYRQVMVSARELELDNLAEQSQTFVNKRFKYTHGHGITLTTVSEFTPEGLPNLLVKNIPPESAHPDLEVTQPRLYYGELTDTHVIVNSDEAEFDYPKGDENVYIRYDGRGGVQISNLWRKFVFGKMFDGTRLFLSGYPNPESRIMFRRQIHERVRELAPFLDFDNDAYIVLAEGRLYWIIDAYTTSEYFPYSEAFLSGGMSGARRRQNFLWRGATMHGINYVRNSVKVVVDAYHGNVDFYIFEPEDPLIRVWSKIFPGLFKNQEEMPDYLRKHVRYPADMLLIQGLIYAKYHMTDPEVFYNQEDLWVRATEKYYGNVQHVEPYYIMWEQPGSDEPEFVLILPFTPKNRQVLIGWIAGMCDDENYGRLLAYKFPKEKRILGTQQVETKIDQDSFLSGQLSLWDQRGSRVIRGNVLVIPLDKTIIYVEPIYLQSDTAAYPELRLVVVMHGDRLSYAETFDKALEGLFAETVPAVDTAAPAGQSTLKQLITQANQHFNDYLAAMGESRFDSASEALERLRGTLEQMSELQDGGSSGAMPDEGTTQTDTTKGETS
ncbi:MAG: UPF0182 family protein [Candidatus Hydrogenedentota bacterium]